MDILTPVGRLVAGSLYKPNEKDFQGNPLTIKTGPNAGQPRIEFFFALAIPKGGEQHWAETEWGAKIWQTGHGGFQGGQAQQPDFAWKVTDGDSQVPNKRNVAPCTKSGYPGHWVLAFSSGWAPNLYTMVGSPEPAQLMEPNAIQTGYYVQVSGTVESNGNMSNPGVYLNHGMVCLQGYGEVIHSGPNVADVGFGNVPLPPGATAAPVGGTFNPAPVAPANSFMPGPAPGAPAAVAPAAGYPPAAGAPAANPPVAAVGVTPATVPAAAYVPPATVAPGVVPVAPVNGAAQYMNPNQ